VVKTAPKARTRTRERTRTRTRKAKTRARARTKEPMDSDLPGSAGGSFFPRLRARGLLAWDGSEFCFQRPRPLVVKTHWAPGEVKWDGGMAAVGSTAKVIVVARNPKDAAISMFKQSQQFSLAAGREGFEPFVRLFLSGSLPLTDPKDFWKFYGEWWAAADNNPSVLWIFFEHLKKDACKEIRRVADFLGVEADDDLIRRTAEASSFESMKSSGGEQLQMLLNSGKSGGWREQITGELDEEFDRAHGRKMKDFGVQFDFDFGKST